MTKVTFFHTVEELCTLADLDREHLWNVGFNLDDWDWGFCSETQFKDEWESPDYMHFLLNRMESYCCGYEENYYNGKWYYLLYHS